MVSTGCWALGAGSWALGAGRRAPGVGRCALSAGCRRYCVSRKRCGATGRCRAAALAPSVLSSHALKATSVVASSSSHRATGTPSWIMVEAAATAPSAGESSGHAPQIAYGGEEAAAQWKREEKERKKEKKEKRKAKKQKRKEKKKAKITQLMEEKGKSFEEATNMVEVVYSESDSDSESD